MTPDHDIDRILDAFLADGAHEVPDRVLDAAFERIERTPQVRLARPTRRFPRMLPTVRLGVAAVLALTLGVVVSPMLAPSPVPSPTPRPTPGYLPPELQHHWLAPSRQLTEMGTSQDRAILRIGQSSVTIFSGPEDYDGNGRPIEAGIDADGDLVIRNAAALDGCEPGSTGIYTPALTDEGQHLSLALVSDDCAVRGQWMAGDDWIRSQCLNPDNQCLGIVEPGTYPSQFFSPRVPLGDDWRPQLGSLQVTVPAGWALSDDWPSNYGIMPAAVYEQTWGDGFPAGPDAIGIFARPSVVTQADACGWSHATGGGETIDELAAAITSIPGISATTPEAIQIGGHPGLILDVRIADGWTGTCADVDGGWPFVPLFAEGIEDGYRLGIGGLDPAVVGTDPQRMVLLDIGAGDVVLIDLDTLREEDLAGFADRAMPIVESLTFAD